MSFLHVYHEKNAEQPLLSTEDGERIAEELAAHGVRFERWPLKALPADAEATEILSAYEQEVSRLKQEGGFVVADIIHMTPQHPDKDALREKFLDEHRHSEDEVRFFVRGEGIFYLHLDNRVYAVGCSQGDLMSVPTGVAHWFDMGPSPDFTCIRLFIEKDGWVAKMTGDDIAAGFPRFEQLSA